MMMGEVCKSMCKKDDDRKDVQKDKIQKSSDELDGDEEYNMKNRRIKRDKEDILYHLALGNKSHDLVEMFGDIKFICMGGTAERMEKFAYYIIQETGYKICPGTMLQDLSAKSNRYALFKAGPVMSVSHGMGMPSLTILLHELIKLMYHAGVKNPIFFRLGTSGGLGVEPGTVVVTTEALNGELEPVHKMAILGKAVNRPAVLDQHLAEEIIQLQEPSDNFRIIGGKTLSTDDFYEGQGRLDGAFCYYTEEEKIAFLNHARDSGVTNIEMEATALAAMTHQVGIKTAVICVTLLDRLKGDQICQPKETLNEWSERPMIVAARFIKKYLEEHTEIPKSYAAARKNRANREEKLAQNNHRPPTKNSSVVVSSETHLKRVMNESDNIIDE